MSSRTSTTTTRTGAKNMEENYVHVIPASPTTRDYFIRLWQSITNQPDIVYFPKSSVRQMYKEMYPRAKV